VCSASIAFSSEEILRAPEIILERWQVINDTTTRTTLFDNQVAVVTVREQDVPIFFLKTTLNDGDFSGYAVTAIRDIEALENSDRFTAPQDGDLNCVLRYMTASGEIRRIRYSPIFVSDLQVSRLLATLDAIETVVRETLPGEELLKSWQPRVGDVVELRSGGLARVNDVREEGFIELEHLDVGIVEFVGPLMRARTILRVVEQ